MGFSSVIFLFYFLPITLACYYIAPQKWRNFVFLLASLFFYAWGETRYVLLLLLSIGMNYAFGLLIGRTQARAAKAWLILALVANIAFLGLFKYTAFAAENINALFGISLSVPKIHLPMGISFFTFQAISYVVDVYRGEAQAQPRVSRVAYYIASFPRLVVGPITRFPDAIAEIEHRTYSSAQVAEGVSRFLVGLSKKVLLSDSLGGVADTMFRLSSGELTAVSAWLGIVCYTLQIYFDFGGYSDMAIGLGKMFGFTINENFNYPYICTSVKDFWRRWHISLSSWFRDYVYIPLGGNRCTVAKQVRNLLVVWFLTGLWHGAAWTFIAWGVYYGLWLLAERYFEPWRAKLPVLLQHSYAILIVMIGWVFFRADNMRMAGNYLAAMFGFAPLGFADATARMQLHDHIGLLAVAILACTPLMKQLYMRLCARFGEAVALPVRLLGGMAAFALCVLFMVNSNYNPFIYFRF